jgi:hypothetical protein
MIQPFEAAPIEQPARANLHKASQRRVRTRESLECGLRVPHRGLSYFINLGRNRTISGKIITKAMATIKAIQKGVTPA